MEHAKPPAKNPSTSTTQQASASPPHNHHRKTGTSPDKTHHHMRRQQTRPLLTPTSLGQNLFNNIPRNNLGQHTQRDPIRQPIRRRIAFRSLYLPNTRHP